MYGFEDAQVPLFVFFVWYSLATVCFVLLPLPLPLPLLSAPLRLFSIDKSMNLASMLSPWFLLLVSSLAQKRKRKKRKAK